MAGILAGLGISGMAIAFLGGWRPPEEPEELPESIAEGLLENFFASVPIIGNNVKSGYDSQYGFRGLDIVPVAFTGGKLIGDIKSGDAEKISKDIVNVIKDLGVTTGMPVTAASRAVNIVKYRDLFELLGYSFTQYRRD